VTPVWQAKRRPSAFKFVQLLALTRIFLRMAWINRKLAERIWSKLSGFEGTWIEFEKKIWHKQTSPLLLTKRVQYVLNSRAIIFAALKLLGIQVRQQQHKKIRCFFLF
jgi:hypothetical protein